MEKFLTQESPAKVMSLLGGALASMFFLFMVTASGASFDNAQAMPDPFASQNVVAILDVTANSYNNFLQAYLIQPATEQYAFVGDDVAFIVDNAGPQIAQLTGFSNWSNKVALLEGQVAGASTKNVVSDYYPAHKGGVFSLFVGN